MGSKTAPKSVLGISAFACNGNGDLIDLGATYLKFRHGHFRESRGFNYSGSSTLFSSDFTTADQQQLVCRPTTLHPIGKMTVSTQPYEILRYLHLGLSIHNTRSKFVNAVTNPVLDRVLCNSRVRQIEKCRISASYDHTTSKKFSRRKCACLAATRIGHSQYSTDCFRRLQSSPARFMSEAVRKEYLHLPNVDIFMLCMVEEGIQ